VRSVAADARGGNSHDGNSHDKSMSQQLKFRRSRVDGRTIAQSFACRKFSRAASSRPGALAQVGDLSYLF